MSVGNSNLTGIPRVAPPVKHAVQANQAQVGQNASVARQAATGNAPVAQQAPTVATAVSMSGTLSVATSGATTVSSKAGAPAPAQAGPAAAMMAAAAMNLLSKSRDKLSSSILTTVLSVVTGINSQTPISVHFCKV